MKKYFSLIKACMSEGMNIFKISTKNKNNVIKVLLPIVLTLVIMSAFYSYSELIISKLEVFNMEFVLLTLFVIGVSVITLVEGIYKSSSLLFNCKDDNLLFSLPIRKRTVLLIRILKFYLFELAYNSIFILPAIIVYAVHVKPDITYYLVSFIGLILFPIIPILISCLIGMIITFIASKFKSKNILQTILTVIFLLGVMYISYNSEKLIMDIANNASSINEFFTKLYYPAGAYIELVQNFSILKMIEFIVINVSLSIITVFLIGKVYFKINSSNKVIKIKKLSKQYKVKSTSQLGALIKKEFNRFINSTVFVTNAGFGLVLFILGCILFIIKYDGLVNMISEINPSITPQFIENNISILLFSFICFSSFMTSITSSMISLEGKSINVLKSLPIKTFTIIQSKVLAAIIIMIPCFLIGDMIVFCRFNINVLDIFLILISSVLFPLLSETIGIIVNLKYPRMDAKNDTEVVKQSMSSAISVFIGMGLTGLTLFLLFKSIDFVTSSSIILIRIIAIYAIVYTVLLILLHKTCEKSFKKISV